VTDSISWQRFCRIGVGGRVPHPTTLMKITTRCGSAVVDQLNEVLLAKAVEARLVKTNRVRADTTVVEANVKYPTDSGLLTRAIGRASRLVERIQAVGAASRTTTVDNTAQARSHAHSIGVWLRRRSGEARDEVLAITGRIADLAVETMADAVRVVRNARRHLKVRPDTPKAGRVRAIVNELETLVDRANRVIGQTRQRIAGEMPPGATRLVSLHDPDARPISKGRLGKPVEFGYKAQVVDNEDGIILDHTVEIGNPQTPPNSFPPSNESSSVVDAHPTPSPPTAGTAKPPSTSSSKHSASGRWRFPDPAHPQRNDEQNRTRTTFGNWSDGEPAPKDASQR
jgi:IS5 family transposase